jgi:hypothetical protein
MNDDEINVTTRTSLHRREAWPLIIEGYRVMGSAAAARGHRLLAWMRRNLLQVAGQRSRRGL